MTLERLNETMRIDHMFNHVERRDHVNLVLLRRIVERGMSHIEISLARQRRARRARFESLPGPFTRHARQENTITTADVENRSAGNVLLHKFLELFVEQHVA